MVSVIVPCYNYGHLIADTINSLLLQSYHDIEVIVINDGSKDNTENVVMGIAQKDKRVRCYTFPNTGLAASRNRGVEKSNGDFIQFLDADDLVEKKKFEEQLKLFAQHPEADVVYGSVRYFTKDAFDPADRMLAYWGNGEDLMPKLNGKGREIIQQALKGTFTHMSAALFRRNIVDKVGDFDNEISAVADYHFTLRCTIANAFFLYHDTPDTYSLVRWHPDNMSKNPRLMWSEELKMRIKLRPLLQDLPAAVVVNEFAIKNFSYQLNNSWKKIFLSGGRFEFLKKALRTLGLERLAKKIFYNQN